MGGIYKGRDLGRTLRSHAASFTNITSVTAEMTQRGVEPPLSVEARSLLFSMAHNSLTNAYRHAEACGKIMESDHEIRVVMLTASTEEDAVVEAMAAGATGYLQKDAGRDRLLATVRDVAAGELRVPTEVVTRVLAGIRAGAETGDAAARAGLTAREREILASFATGMSYAQIEVCALYTSDLACQRCVGNVAVHTGFGAPIAETLSHAMWCPRY